MAKFKTHYDSLNVSRNAPLSVIKAAYKVLCQNYHPDKFAGGHDEALRIIKVINSAYAILSDSEKRAEHDQWIARQEREHANYEAQRIMNIITQAYVPPPVTIQKDLPSQKTLSQKSWENARLIANKLRFVRNSARAGSGINNNIQRLKKSRRLFRWIAVIGIVLTTALLYPPQQATVPVNQDVAGILAQAKQWMDQGQVAKALPLYLLLAKEGNAEAQFQAGLIYANGRDIAKDDKQAVDWLDKAAGQGNRDAQSKLGFMYATGKGAAQNNNLAVYWCYKAAIQGDAIAQYHLGLMYEKGQGVAKDNSLAASWFSKAAAQGYARAQDHLGDLHSKQEPAAKDGMYLKSMK